MHELVLTHQLEKLVNTVERLGCGIVRFERPEYSEIERLKKVTAISWQMKHFNLMFQS